MVHALYGYLYNLQNLEYLFLRFIQERMRSTKLDFIMRLASSLGNFGLIWIILTLILAYTPFADKKTANFLASGLTLHVIVCNILLKNIFARKRPLLNCDFSLLVKKHKDYSFPSGHACSSFIIATLLYLVASPLFFIALPLACIISISRVYLSVHYPSDVLVGILLGIGIAYFTHTFSTFTLL